MSLELSLYQSAKIALKEGSKTFHFASLFLARSRRVKITLFYWWCREVDDSIDEASPEQQQIFLQKAFDWFSQTQAADPTPSWKGLRVLLESHPDLEVYCRDLLRGMKMDSVHEQPQNEDELEDYCYCVAGTVGAALCILSGVREPSILQSAIKYGKSLQLINIARDLKEDERMGRCYLPKNWMKESDSSEQQYLTLIPKLLDKAEKLFKEGEPDLHFLPLGLALPFGIAGSTYFEIGRKIQQDPKKSLQQRTVVSLFSKMKCAAKFIFIFFSQR